MTTRRDILIAGLSGFGAQLIPSISYAAPVATDYTAKISPVNQGNANLCWLAAAAMIQSFQLNKPVSMENTASSLGEPYVSKLRDPNQAALDFSLVNDLALKLHMKVYGLASFDLNWWTSKLATGPLWVGGQDKNGKMGHVKVLTGIVGDTSDIPKLYVRGIDPDGAKKFDQPFREFIAFYEGIPRKYPEFPNQIFAMS